MNPQEIEQPTPNFSGVPVEALESLRLRLTQLTHSLNKLQTEMRDATLPHWVSLQNQFNIILTQLGSLSSTLANYADILEKTVTYPLPQFPTTEQEGLLTTLLRKKASPEVVEWIEESKSKSTDILLKDDEDITKWAVKLTVDMRDEFNLKGEEDVLMEDIDAPKTNGNFNDILKFMYQGKLP